MIKHGRGKTAFLFIVMILTMVLVRFPSPTHAQFVLASWDPLDEYGQGIPYVGVYNGSQWLINRNSTYQTAVEINADTNLTLAVFVWLNGTVAGISSTEEGRDRVQHSVVVSTPSNSSVFSQQGFTFIVDTGESNAPMYFYRHDVILDFTLVAGQIYTATVTYEVLGLDTNTTTATTGSFSGTGEVNSWASTQAKDSTDWYGDVSCSLILNFTIPSDTWEFEYHVFAYREGVVSGGAWLEIYNFTSSSWVQVDTLTDTPAWYNDTISDSDYMDTTNNVVMIRLDSDFLYYPRWDYADITIRYGLETVGVAQLIFHIPWDPTFQFGYDAFFIFLGLIMIPVSTMYLVRGGREEASADKVFYFLIIFMVGLGLLVGGIMP